MGKQEKSKSGTILKVVSDNFTKEQLEELWQRHNETLQELEVPTEKYTRYTSDLIKSLRDVSEQLILAGAIPDATSQKDTARYVWKKLQERKIPYNRADFYKYFSPEQKRDWQTDEDSQMESSDHKHEFQSIGNIDGMGEVARCGAPCISKCYAMLIDGRLFEEQELDEHEPELKAEKPKTSYEEQNEDCIVAYEEVIARLKAVLSVWRTTNSNLTAQEKQELAADLYTMKKAGEFLDMCYNRKTLIDPYTLHLLTLAYAEGTQKLAGGVFIKYRIDLAERRHGEGVKTFTQMGEFAKLLTPKQTTKAMKGLIRRLNERCQPQNEKQSMDAGFSGQQCTDCHYWRVGYSKVLNQNWKKGKKGWVEGDDPKDKPDPIHEKFDTVLMCIDCNQIQTRKHFTLPKQVPLVTIDYSKAI